MQLHDTKQQYYIYVHVKTLVWAGSTKLGCIKPGELAAIYRCVSVSILSVSMVLGPSWPWSYGRWIYNNLCNQWVSLLKLWVQTPFMMRCNRYNIICDKVCRWLATGRWLSPGTPVSSTNKTDNCTEYKYVSTNSADLYIISSWIGFGK
jgi:hypothetical protein